MEIKITCRTCGKEGHDSWGTIGGWTVCEKPKDNMPTPNPMSAEEIDPIRTAKLINRLESDVRTWFGYVEKWREYPVRDYSEYWWERPSQTEVLFYDSREALEREDEDRSYSAEVRGSYERGGIWLFELDTHTDGNVYLAIFDGKKYAERS